MLDAMDRKLLVLLQRDASLSVAEIGERVGLSATPCWRRIKRLEEDGYIEKRVVLVNRNMVGLPVTAFVNIRTNHYDRDWLKAFKTATANLPEIVEVYDMSGDVDYLMKIVVADIESLNRVCETLLLAVNIAHISSAFVLEQIKHTTEVPVDKVDFADASRKARQLSAQARKTKAGRLTTGNLGIRQSRPNA